MYHRRRVAIRTQGEHHGPAPISNPTPKPDPHRTLLHRRRGECLCCIPAQWCQQLRRSWWNRRGRNFRYRRHQQPGRRRRCLDRRHRQFHRRLQRWRLGWRIGRSRCGGRGCDGGNRRRSGRRRRGGWRRGSATAFDLQGRSRLSFRPQLQERRVCQPEGLQRQPRMWLDGSGLRSQPRLVRPMRARRRLFVGTELRFQPLYQPCQVPGPRRGRG